MINDIYNQMMITIDDYLYSSYTIFIILFIIVFFLIYQIFKYSSYRITFPGPKGSWLNGNINELLSDNAHEYWLKWNREYGQIFQVYSSFIRNLMIPPE